MSFVDKICGKLKAKQRTAMSARWLAAALLLPLLVSCGYKVATRNRAAQPFTSVAVLPLENQTSTFEVEQILTRSLIQTFVEKADFQLVNDPSFADAVMRGVISGVNASPVTFGAGSFGNTFLVTLTARIELKDRRSGETLFRNDNYIFREQYVINTDLENFFSEQNPALERIARDFASSVVTAILERY